MTYQEQKEAIDLYSNYLKVDSGFRGRVTRILDDYLRVLTQLNEADQLGEVAENLYHSSYLPIKKQLEELGEKVATQNANALDDISNQLAELIKKANQGLISE